MYINGDFHTHGSFSHGNGETIKNVRYAWLKGLKSIAITEHGLTIWSGGLRNKNLADVKAEVEKARKAYPTMNVYYGVEANIVSPEGEIDIPSELENEFEIVLVGMHYFVFGTKYLNVIRIVWRNALRKFIRRREKLRAINTRALVNAMHNYRIDALSHLGTSMPDYDLAAVAAAAEETDTCIEINAKHCSLSLEQLRYLAKTNVKFLINSDAHEPELVGEADDAVKLAFSAGIRPENILNIGKNTYIPKRLRGGV